MDNNKKILYLKYLLIGMFINNILIFAAGLFSPVKIIAPVLFVIQMLALSGFFYALEKRTDRLKEFLSNKDVKNLEKVSIFYSEEEETAFDSFIHNKEEKKNLFLASKREAQVLALQNQINPHFLYNTLETIRSDAISNGAFNAGTMAEALATFFRYTISNLDYLVQIVDELENIQNYFTIQHYRFGNKISIQILYDENDKNILKLYIPKLIMQPIVENAIYHGIEQKLGAGQVTIHINYTKQNLDIMISDDGIGIKENILWEMNNRLWTDSENYARERTNKGGGIAIRNVNQRIKLLFGEDYGIRLNSIYGIGTDVHIKLPVLLTPNDLGEKVYFENEETGGSGGEGTDTF